VHGEAQGIEERNPVSRLAIPEVQSIPVVTGIEIKQYQEDRDEQPSWIF
jgi:hypothetical protein